MSQEIRIDYGYVLDLRSSTEATARRLREDEREMTTWTTIFLDVDGPPVRGEPDEFVRAGSFFEALDETSSAICTEFDQLDSTGVDEMQGAAALAFVGSSTTSHRPSTNCRGSVARSRYCSETMSPISTGWSRWQRSARRRRWPEHVRTGTRATRPTTNTSPSAMRLTATRPA